MNTLPKNLPELLRAAGLTVVEVSGWHTRSRPGSFAPVGALNHHTGASASGWSLAKELEYARWMFLTGRPDPPALLPAPLCQIALGRSGVVYVGAAGRANHAGTAQSSGSVSSGDGNVLYVGIEWMLSGTEKIPSEMMAAAVTLNAVLTEKVTDTSVQTISCHYQTSITGKWDIGDPEGVPFRGTKVLDVHEFRERVAAERTRLFHAPPVAPLPNPEYRWLQPGKRGQAASGCALGVRRGFAKLENPRTIAGSRATHEGGGIRERTILKARVSAEFFKTSVAVGHAPPPRAAKAREEFMRAMSRVRAPFKGGDFNMVQRMAERALGRSVVGRGVVWLAIPRKSWRVLKTETVNVRGDHKAVLVTVRHLKSKRVMTVLVINAMSVSASAEKSSRIMARGLNLGADVVLAVECSDFRARDVDRNRKSRLKEIR